MQMERYFSLSPLESQGIRIKRPRKIGAACKRLSQEEVIKITFDRTELGV